MIGYFHEKQSTILIFFTGKSLAIYQHVPGSLVVRIPRSHRGGRGSIPRLGKYIFRKSIDVR